MNASIGEITKWKQERAEASARVEATKSAVYTAQRRIYAALVEAARLIPALRAAGVEYSAALRANDQPSAGAQIRLISVFTNRLTKGIVEILQKFPDRIFKEDASLPAPGEVLKNAKS